MQFVSNPPNTARQYSVWLCFKCSILHRLSLYCQGDISWGGPGGCLCASSPLCCLLVREDGGKAKKRTPLSPCEVGTLGKIDAKIKVNWTVLKMYSVNYCISVKQEIPNLRFTLEVCTGSKLKPEPGPYPRLSDPTRPDPSGTVKFRARTRPEIPPPPQRIANKKNGKRLHFTIACKEID